MACFKELNDDDYGEIDRLLKKKQERDRGNSGGSGSVPGQVRIVVRGVLIELMMRNMVMDG